MQDLLCHVTRELSRQPVYGIQLASIVRRTATPKAARGKFRNGVSNNADQ